MRSVSVRLLRGAKAHLDGERSSSGRRGVILILVLWVCIGLAGIAVTFGHSMMLERRAAANSLAGLQASQASRGAARYVSYLLKNAEEKGTLPDPETYDFEDVEIGDSRVWMIGRGENTADSATFGLVDEASKMNLNTATREMIEALPRMTSEFAAAIIDWRDENQEPEADGAESDAYSQLDAAYIAKDGALETIEELRLVRGATEEILLGEDLNANGILDTWEEEAESSDHDGELDPGILECLTVYSREPNKQAGGEARHNINDRSPQARQQLRDFLTQELGSLPSGAASGGSNYYSILEFYYESGISAEDFAKVEDGLSTSSDEYLRGRVNVNTASAAVLACIPGVDESSAESLVAWREGKTREELKSITWITQVLERANALQAGPFVTTHGYQFSADIAATGPHPHALLRSRYVFDTSGDEPVIVYYRDLSDLGWPLGIALRDEILAPEQTEERFE